MTIREKIDSEFPAPIARRMTEQWFRGDSFNALDKEADWRTPAFLIDFFSTFAHTKERFRFWKNLAELWNEPKGEQVKETAAITVFSKFRVRYE